MVFENDLVGSFERCLDGERLMDYVDAVMPFFNHINDTIEVASGNFEAVEYCLLH